MKRNTQGLFALLPAMQLLKIEKIPVQLSARGASKSQDNIKNGYYTFN